MRLQSINFAGYRSFAARSPSASNRPLESLKIAPLTILIGKNNSGKSNVARFLQHVLLALAAEGKDPFPMSDGRHSYGLRFRDVQHGGNFFNPVDLNVELRSEDGSLASLEAQLIQLGDRSDESPPVPQAWKFKGNDFSNQPVVRGLLPDTESAIGWRREASELLAGSCHLGPLRDPIKPSYSFNPNAKDTQAPESNSAIAQLLASDLELRTSVGNWISQNLDDWRVDVQQTLDDLKLIARRRGRESNLADSGQGIQQVLPIVALSCWRILDRGTKPFLDLLEQPELHLHDAAHAAIGDLLLSVVRDGRGNIVTETHSESLVLRVRRRIAEGLPPDQVSIVYVEDLGDGSKLRSIPVDSNGEVGWWPEGVFSEAFLETKAIRRAQRAKAK